MEVSGSQQEIPASLQWRACVRSWMQRERLFPPKQAFLFWRAAELGNCNQKQHSSLIPAEHLIQGDSWGTNGVMTPRDVLAVFKTIFQPFLADISNQALRHKYFISSCISYLDQARWMMAQQHGKECTNKSVEIALSDNRRFEALADHSGVFFQ